MEAENEAKFVMNDLTARRDDEMEFLINRAQDRYLEARCVYCCEKDTEKWLAAWNAVRDEIERRGLKLRKRVHRGPDGKRRTWSVSVPKKHDGGAEFVKLSVRPKDGVYEKDCSTRAFAYVAFMSGKMADCTTVEEVYRRIRAMQDEIADDMDCEFTRLEVSNEVARRLGMKRMELDRGLTADTIAKRLADCEGVPPLVIRNIHHRSAGHLSVLDGNALVDTFDCRCRPFREVFAPVEVWNAVYARLS